MTALVACLTTGKGTWGHVSRIIEEMELDQIFLITNEFGQKNFNHKKPVQFIIIDNTKQIKELVQDIKDAIEDKICGTEVALNLISGTGKEHMAIIAAIIQSGLGFRLVVLTKDGVIEI